MAGPESLQLVLARILEHEAGRLAEHLRLTAVPKLPIVLVCRSCGRENPDEARFCMACATPLVGEGPAEERKVVTALFCDLVGFTARSDRADPEDIQAALRPYFARVRREIERFGGVVEKFIGDAVVGVFGVPAAHEDDPERGVRAAFGILEAIEELNSDQPELGLAVRVAVNTGEAVVSLGTSPLSGEGFVTGDVLNTASRMQALAPEGGVVVGDLTQRATRRSIEYEELAPATVKGKAEPLRIWRAVALSPAGPEERAHLSPLVGRDGELSALLGEWDRSLRLRRPHLVTLLGPPGIGKSRLLRELGRRIAHDGRLVAGRCRPYGETTGYGAFGQIVQRLASIFDTDPAAIAREKLVARLRALFPDEDVEEVGSRLEILLGLSEEGQPDRHLLLFSARRFMEAVASEQPTVLAFEDVHWATPSLLDLLESVADKVEQAPLLIVASARPDLLDNRPGWAETADRRRVVSVDPLSDDEARELARRLLVEGDERIEAVDSLVQVGGGNPLFLEELVASVAERRETLAEALPTTVQAIITARLDALPSPERRVIQAASVIGRSFWEGVLRSAAQEADALGDALASLEARDFISRQPTSRIPGDREYLFKHALTREVAYSTLPRAIRRARHRAVAQHLEEALGDRVRDSASLLATHWKEAGEARRAAEYLMTAAEVASRAWAKQQAVALYDEAIDLLQGAEEADLLEQCVVARAGIRLEVGISRADLEEELEVLSPISGRHRPRALLTSAMVAMNLNDAPRSRFLAEQAAAAARDSGEAELEAQALEALSEVAGMDGQVERAIVLIGDSIRTWPAGTRTGHYPETLTQAALYHYWRGTYEEGARLGVEGFERGMESSNLVAVLGGAGHAGLCLTGLSRHEEALEWYDRGVRLGRDWEQVPRHTSRVVNMRAGTLREIGDLEGARRANEEGLEMGQQASFVGSLLGAQVDLLIHDVLEGNLGRAEKELPRLLHAAAETRGWHQWLWTGRLLHAKAQIALALGRYEETAAAASSALEHALGPPRLKYRCRSRTILGAALVGLGRAEEGLLALDHARAEAERLGHTPSLWPVLEARAAALDALGRADDADRDRALAVELAGTFASRLSAERRKTFLASALAPVGLTSR